MCEDIKKGCSTYVIEFLQRASSLKESLLYDWKTAERNLSNWFDCDYLPSRYRTIPCIYRPVTCHAPPSVTNAIVLNGLDLNETYVATSQAGYSCQNEQFQMNGNSTVTCLYSGQWSDLSQMRPGYQIPLHTHWLLLYHFWVFLSLYL